MNRAVSWAEFARLRALPTGDSDEVGPTPLAPPRLVSAEFGAAEAIRPSADGRNGGER